MSYNKTDYSNNNPAIAMEHALIAYLNELGFKAIPSTKRDNIKLDIDTWLCDPETGEEETPVSIKYMEAAQKYNNLSFEISVKVSASAQMAAANRKKPKYLRSYLPSASGRWLPSWAAPTSNMGSSAYLVYTGKRLFWIEKDAAWHAYLNSCWDAYFPTRYRRVAERNELPGGACIKRLSRKLRERQQAMRHPHTDAENLIVPIDYLLESGLAVELPAPKFKPVPKK